MIIKCMLPLRSRTLKFSPAAIEELVEKLPGLKVVLPDDSRGEREGAARPRIDVVGRVLSAENVEGISACALIEIDESALPAGLLDLIKGPEPSIAPGINGVVSRAGEDRNRITGVERLDSLDLVSTEPEKPRFQGEAGEMSFDVHLTVAPDAPEDTAARVRAVVQHLPGAHRVVIHVGEREVWLGDFVRLTEESQEKLRAFGTLELKRPTAENTPSIGAADEG